MNNNELLENSFKSFPSTRYQGSKRKILELIYHVSSEYEFDTVLDMFSGSGVVSLLYRAMGKKVHANDFLLNCASTARLFLNYENGFENKEDVKQTLKYLLADADINEPGLIEQNFKNIYFKENENKQLDRFCQNIQSMSGLKKDLYIYAVSQACLKKRPYNLFHRANLNMRTKDIQRTFGNHATWEAPIIEHAYKCIMELERFDFPEKREHTVTSFNSVDLECFDKNMDLVYLDPPYLGSNGRSIDYADFYHFLEGICEYQLFSNGDAKYPHKPIVKKPSPWLSTESSAKMLTDIVDYFDRSIIILNYRSDSTLTHERVAEIFAMNGRKSKILTAGQYQYALSKNKQSEELFIISEPA